MYNVGFLTFCIFHPCPVDYFREQDNRLFPASENAPTVFPADEDEVKRLALQHHFLKLLLGKNWLGPVEDFLAPSPDGRRKRVLEIRTRAGFW